MGGSTACCPTSPCCSISTRRPLARRLDADDKPFDRLEAEREDFHARVRDRFLAIAADEPARFLVLDAARPADDLAADIRARVESLLAPEGDVRTRG